MMLRSLTLSALLVFALPSLHAQGDAAAGATTFSTTCAACHGADGRGGERGPNIAGSREVAQLSDADLASFIRNGVPSAGMPSFSFLGDKVITDLVAHLRVLQGRTGNVSITGDRESGKALFFGRAECSKCHRIENDGGFIATDLSDYGAITPPDRIRAAILDADATVGLKAEVLEVTTATGEKVRGAVRTEDSFTLVLQQESGQLRRFKKSKLGKIHRTGHSLMPRDYANRLEAVQIDDLVAYIVLAARQPLKPAPGARP